MDQELDGHFLESDATFVAGKIKEDDEFQVSIASFFPYLGGGGLHCSRRKKRKREKISWFAHCDPRIVSFHAQSVATKGGTKD